MFTVQILQNGQPLISEVSLSICGSIYHTMIATSDGYYTYIGKKNTDRGAYINIPSLNYEKFHGHGDTINL